jgi:hypothetical protein
MKNIKNKIQAQIAPGPNGVYKPAVKPFMSNSYHDSSQSSTQQASPEASSSSSLVDVDGPLLVDNSNFADVVRDTVDTNYCHRILKECGGPETFMECWDERAMPKLRASATAKEQKDFKTKKEMKNQCSKILLAITRLSFFEQYLLMPSKRLNCIPEFDKYCN